MSYQLPHIPADALLVKRLIQAKVGHDRSDHSVGQQLATLLHVAASVALALLRVLTGLNIYWLLIPGYLIALILTRFVPKVFVGIAFDSGGVASGPMTSTFLLPLAMGACTAIGGNVVTDAFGVVAMVAMAPLIAVQVMGVSYNMKLKKASTPAAAIIGIDDNEILDFEEDF